MNPICTLDIPSGAVADAFGFVMILGKLVLNPVGTSVVAEADGDGCIRIL